MSQRKLGLFVSVVIGSAAMIACGGGGSGSPAADFDSVEDLAAAMDAPTGTVDATTATPVAEEFANINENGGALGGAFGGVRQKTQAESASIDCSGGGSIDAEGDETQVHATYNSCSEGGCVIDGEISIFVSTAGSYSGCYSFDLSATCDAESVSAAGSYCVNGETGTIEYLVAVNGETYTVSGYYADGTGELTITGANGVYTCTYTDGTGSCVDEAGAEFTF